jgi:hypothetical protein
MGTVADWHGTGRPRQRLRPPGIGLVLLADLDEVDRPGESRLIRWIATTDGDALGE